MNKPLTLSIKGFRSLKDVTVTLGGLNVLIGGNGSGKSNLIDLFRMIESMMRGDLQLFVGRSGGAATLLHQGPKVTGKLEISVTAQSADPRYETAEAEFALEWGADDKLFLSQQQFAVRGGDTGYNGFMEGDSLTSTVRECVLATQPNFGSDHPAPGLMRALLSGWKAYHFQDTSAQAGIRAASDVSSGFALRGTGENLAAFLLHLRENHHPYYQRIVAVIQSVAPYFRDFLLLPAAGKVGLRWRSLSSEYEFGAHQLSDGTLRFMALTALLLQPDVSLPTLIAIDEPELGLHPYAVSVFAGLVRSAAARSQILVATQSPTLLDEFDPNDVIVVEQHHGCSQFRRLDAVALDAWLEDYSLSELWEKNQLGGRPTL